MQKSRGSEMSASAACSLCFARTWGGITGTNGGCARFRRNQTRASVTAVTTTSAPSTHHTQAQELGISTGGLMARMPFVAATGEGDGTRMAELLERTLNNRD